MPTLVDTTDALLFIPTQLDIKAEIQVTEELLPVLLWEQSDSIQANLMKNLSVKLRLIVSSD